jgi:hypothetical protein
VTASFTAVWDTMIGQQRDPVAFLQDAYIWYRKLWWPAWKIRGTIFVVMLATLGTAAWVTRANWKLLFGPALLLLLAAQMLCGLFIMVLGEAQFWLLYAYSPPVILMAWLCGMGSLLPLGPWLGLQVGFSFLVGKIFADGCAIWVYQRLRKARNEQCRLRGDNLSIASLVIASRLRTRQVRLWAASILACIIIYCYHALPAQNLIGYCVFGKWACVLHTSISLCAGVSGCLGLEATLCAIVWNIPPVRFVANHWQATYSGRTALWIPVRHIHRFCTPEQSITGQSHVIITLLTQGCLAPVVRRACRALSPAYLQQLLLSLSLQEGGSASIRYLNSALPPVVQSIGLFYADLADEAAKPLDLQCWIHILGSQFSTTATNSVHYEIPSLLILSQVYHALLAVKTTPEIPQLLIRLRQFIARLDVAPSLTKRPITTWPSTVLWHLEEHQKQLQSA